jgi:hypothetical protein
VSQSPRRAAPRRPAPAQRRSASRLSCRNPGCWYRGQVGRQQRNCPGCALKSACTLCLLFPDGINRVGAAALTAAALACVTVLLSPAGASAVAPAAAATAPVPSPWAAASGARVCLHTAVSRVHALAPLAHDWLCCAVRLQVPAPPRQRRRPQHTRSGRRQRRRKVNRCSCNAAAQVCRPLGGPPPPRPCQPSASA